MTKWSWKDTRVGADGTCGGLTWPSRADAETWLGENWEDLLDKGVEEVRLYCDEEPASEPMSLMPPE